MKILVGIWHPAHVHFFKNMIWNLQKDGHEVKIVARPKEMTLQLLDAYKLDYELCGAHKKTFLSKILNAIKIERKLYRIAKEFRADILIGILDMYSAHVGWILRKPSIIFTDTEHAKMVNRLTFPFASVICTPSCYKRDLGKKQVRYNGYHELAYLHPNYFKSDLSVLDELAISKDDKFTIMRFVSWYASHDIGQKGFDLETKRKAVKEFEKHGRVFITSENPLPKEFEKYQITVALERIHDLLYYATLYIGDGGTTASEAAILGTPSIHVATTAKYCGVFEDMHYKYDLIYTSDDGKQGLEKAVNFLENNSKKWWASKKEKMLNDKIDVTKFMTEFVENYPQSFYDYQRARNE